MGGMCSKFRNNWLVDPMFMHHVLANLFEHRAHALEDQWLLITLLIRHFICHQRQAGVIFYGIMINSQSQVKLSLLK